VVLFNNCSTFVFYTPEISALFKYVFVVVSRHILNVSYDFYIFILLMCARALIHDWHTQNSVDSDLMQTAANHVRCINTDQFEDF